MEKPIIIISIGIVVVSLIWLVDKAFLAKESAPKTAEKQQDSAVGRQGSHQQSQRQWLIQHRSIPSMICLKKPTGTIQIQLPLTKVQACSLKY